MWSVGRLLGYMWPGELSRQEGGGGGSVQDVPCRAGDLDGICAGRACSWVWEGTL